MAFDGLTLFVIKRELQNALTDGWIRKIYQPAEDLLTFNVWKGANYKLLVSLGDNFRVQLTELDFEHPAQPPSFCMLLRKHLEGGKVKRIRQRGLDRLLEITATQKEEEEIKEKTVFLELMGRNSNLVLVERGQVLDAWHRKNDSRRSLTPGTDYERPPRQDKIPLNVLKRGDLEEKLSPKNGEGKALWRILLGEIEGIGPLMAKEIPSRAGIDPKEEDGWDKGRLWESVDNLRRYLERGEFEPVVYSDEGGPVEYAPYPLVQFEEKGFGSREFSSLSLALDYYHKFDENSYGTNKLREDLKAVVSDELERIQGALKNVREQLKKSRKSESFKRKGDILLANLSELEKGQRQATLNNPYQEGERIEIELDPSLTPQENAQKYYERYKKLKRGKDKLGKRLQQLKKEKGLFEKLRRKVEEAEGGEELHSIEDKLRKGGYIEAEQEEGEKDKGGPKVHWVEGYKVLIGRNARQNDQLIRDSARDNIWLHVRDHAGAHVVIVSDGGPETVPDSVLKKAAQLAAYNSKAVRNGGQAQRGGKVLVSYTLIKYVDKPKGAKPGLVRITNESTIAVEPSGVIS